MSSNWITLNEYSLKHGVSISTLRRRIKSGSVNFKTVQNKYYLEDFQQAGLISPTTQNFVKPPLREQLASSSKGVVPEDSMQKNVDVKMSFVIQKLENLQFTLENALAREKDNLMSVFTDRMEDMRLFFDGVFVNKIENLEGATTNQLEEFRKFFEAMLKAKDDEILALKSEISNLQTLTQILEQKIEGRSVDKAHVDEHNDANTSLSNSKMLDGSNSSKETLSATDILEKPVEEALSFVEPAKTASTSCEKDLNGNILGSVKDNLSDFQPLSSPLELDWQD